MKSIKPLWDIEVTKFDDQPAMRIVFWTDEGEPIEQYQVFPSERHARAMADDMEFRHLAGTYKWGDQLGWDDDKSGEGPTQHNPPLAFDEVGPLPQARAEDWRAWLDEQIETMWCVKYALGCPENEAFFGFASSEPPPNSPYAPQ